MSLEMASEEQTGAVGLLYVQWLDIDYREEFLPVYFQCWIYEWLTSSCLFYLDVDWLSYLEACIH